MSFINNEKENQDILIYMQYFLALSLFEQLKPVSAGELVAITGYEAAADYKTNTMLQQSDEREKY